VRRLEVTPQHSACVSDLVPFLDACRHLTVGLRSTHALEDRCRPPTLHPLLLPLPRIAHLHVKYARVKPLAALLSWFPFLTTLEIESTSPSAAVLSSLAALGDADTPRSTVTELVVSARPLADDGTLHCLAETRQSFADLLAAFPRVVRLRFQPPPPAIVQDELDRVVEARAATVRVPAPRRSRSLR